MPRLLLAFGAIAALSLPSSIAAPVRAQSGLGAVQSVVTLSGTCQRFLMAGRDLTRNCNPTVVNTGYANGRTSFMFAMRDGSIVSFYGRDTRAVGDRATVRIERITVKDAAMRGNPSAARATGRCDYTNPYRGRATISCSAAAMGRSFFARFVSDGRPPVGSNR